MVMRQSITQDQQASSLCVRYPGATFQLLVSPAAFLLMQEGSLSEDTHLLFL